VTFTLKEAEYEEMKKKILEKIFESEKKKVEVIGDGNLEQFPYLILSSLSIS